MDIHSSVDDVGQCLVQLLVIDGGLTLQRVLDRSTQVQCGARKAMIHSYRHVANRDLVIQDQVREELHGVSRALGVSVDQVDVSVDLETLAKLEHLVHVVQPLVAQLHRHLLLGILSLLIHSNLATCFKGQDSDEVLGIDLGEHRLPLAREDGDNLDEALDAAQLQVPLQSQQPHLGRGSIIESGLL